jgi:hypothetical protein
MRIPTYTDSKQGLAQACDLLRYAAQAKKRMPPPGYLWVLTGMVLLVLTLMVAHQNEPKPKPVTQESLGSVPITEAAVCADAPRADVPEVRRASYVIGAQYNIGTEQAPFNVIFRGTEASIDKLMRVPHPREGDMYWVPDTGHCWFLTRVGSTHRLSWVDP